MNKSILVGMITLGIVYLSGCGGATGATGAQGPAGSQGAVGPTGAGLSITSDTMCSKVDSGSGVTLYFEYRYITFSSGDSWVFCAVSGANTESSDNLYYKSGQTGTTNHGCVVTYDINADSDSGFWSFTSNTGPQAVYNDVASPKNGYAAYFTFGGGDCATY